MGSILTSRLLDLGHSAVDDAPDTKGAAPLGVESIDRIGVMRIAEALCISPQAVRKWRQKGKIPDDRQHDLRQLLAALPEQVSTVARVAEVSHVMKIAPPAPLTATKAEAKKGGGKEPPGQTLTMAPANRPRLEQIAGQHARTSMKLLIAARDVDQARVVVDRAEANANGLPPDLPVRGYKLRLAILFALDFPILTMAFVAVTQVSPIIAAGSAIALSLGLVLSAHTAGARLRALAEHISPWSRDLVTLATMLALIAAVIGVATDLRLKGFELDGQFLTEAQAGLFSEQMGVLSSLPESFIGAIVRAAGLVTVLLTIFGISWSYQHHGPQLTFARAEIAYRRALCRYASALKRSKTTSVLAIAVMVSITMVTAKPGTAADCNGLSTFALIDTTTAYDDQDRDQIMPAIDDMAMSLEPGSRLIIRTVRDAPSSSRLLLDACMPVTSTFDWSVSGVWQWLTSNPNAVRVAQAEFHTAIRDSLLPELRQHGDAPGTALVDTLMSFMGEAGQLRSVWLFTDLLESVAIPTETLLSRSGGLLKASKPAPTLSGVDVHVAGVGRFHDQRRRPLTSREYGALIDSWTGFVREAGGELYVSG